MSSGKVHATIGVSTAVIASTALCVYNKSFDPFLVTSVGLGAYVGSLAPDLDSKKSKGSQIFNKILITCLVIFLIIPLSYKIMGKLNICDGLDAPTAMEKFHTSIAPIETLLTTYIVKTNIGLILFILMSILGKMSPHRQFTHKVIGTLGFIVAAVLAFQLNIFIGFTIGYVLHLVADAFTPAGLKFLDIKLPMQKANGKFE